jgi:hypothetical protein
MVKLSMAKLRAFWQRTSDGLSAEQLWTQFRRETRSSLNLYSAESGRDLREEWSARKGRRRVLAAVADAMYRRLTPVRRLLLLLALALLVFPAFVYNTDTGVQASISPSPQKRPTPSPAITMTRLCGPTAAIPACCSSLPTSPAKESRQDY